MSILENLQKQIDGLNSSEINIGAKAKNLNQLNEEIDVILHNLDLISNYNQDELVYKKETLNTVKEQAAALQETANTIGVGTEKLKEFNEKTGVVLHNLNLIANYKQDEIEYEKETLENVKQQVSELKNISAAVDTGAESVKKFKAETDVVLEGLGEVAAQAKTVQKAYNDTEILKSQNEEIGVVLHNLNLVSKFAKEIENAYEGLEIMGNSDKSIAYVIELLAETAKRIELVRDTAASLETRLVNTFNSTKQSINELLDRLAFVKEDIKWLEEKSKHLIVIRVEVDYHHSDSGMVRKLANSG